LIHELLEYIKQHREEIEADKFETRQFKKEELASTQNLEEMIQEVRESSEPSDQVFTVLFDVFV